jgi:hypothetical protein
MCVPVQHAHFIYYTIYVPYARQSMLLKGTNCVRATDLEGADAALAAGSKNGSDEDEDEDEDDEDDDGDGFLRDGARDLACGLQTLLTDSS